MLSIVRAFDHELRGVVLPDCSERVLVQAIVLYTYRVASESVCVTRTVGFFFTLFTLE